LHAFVCADVQTIQGVNSDLTALRPTVFASVPRVYNRMYEKIMSEARKRSPPLTFLLLSAVCEVNLLPPLLFLCCVLFA
jgi:long-subunit acyl-CoA synthetase (AMP-forming)